MKVPEQIFKAYDIRGVYPEEVNEKNFGQIIDAIYSFFVENIKKDNLQIVLACDMRLSSPSLFQIAKETLVSLGATVIDIGLASTPTFYYASLKYGYNAGILISASHNPPEYNGIKFVIRNGDKLIKIAQNTGMERVKELVLSEKISNNKSGGSSIRRDDVLVDDVDFAFKLVGLTINKFKIVADPANAMGIFYLEEVFKRLPCDLIRMNFKLDGTFPAHHPDPLKYETLKSIQERVIEEHADLGIAPDGDGDRIFYIDEKGAIIPATAISSLIAKEILRKAPGEKIIIDVRYTRNAKNIIEKYKGIMLESVVGHSLITEQLNKEHASFAGESSGHFYFRETGGAESSIRTILYVLSVMSREKKPISQIISELTSNSESGEFNFIMGDDLSKEKVFEFISHAHKNAEKIYYVDGITVEYGDWRFNIRTSNTEPLLRLNLEGKDADLVKKRTNEIRQEILKLGAKAK